MEPSFSNQMLHVMQKLNSVKIKDALARGCLPFLVDNKCVGLIRRDVWKYLKCYPNVFIESQGTDSKTKLKSGVHLEPSITGVVNRTDAVNGVLEDLRKKDAVSALRGWRHENYDVRQKFTDEPLLTVERAGSGLFGFIQYGVHVNGYTKDKDGNIFVWVGRRSKTKQTFPDMYDNMCAGGLPTGLSIEECMRKECQEEASVSDDLLDKLTFTGMVSYFYEDERGLFPECQYIFDIELPEDFKPVNADGEVGSFCKVNIEEMKSLMTGNNFKPNCVAVCLDFLIRHGFISPDEDPNCCSYMDLMHTPLQSYYCDI